ncbi:MAG: hypothetical protein R2769_03895 [Saprospiraceae bacterium]
MNWFTKVLNSLPIVIFENGSVVEFNFREPKGVEVRPILKQGETFPINVNGAVLPSDKSLKWPCTVQVTGANTTRFRPG